MPCDTMFIFVWPEGPDAANGSHSVLVASMVALALLVTKAATREVEVAPPEQEVAEEPVEEEEELEEDEEEEEVEESPGEQILW